MSKYFLIYKNILVLMEYYKGVSGIQVGRFFRETKPIMYDSFWLKYIALFEYDGLKLHEVKKNRIE